MQSYRHSRNSAGLLTVSFVADVAPLPFRASRSFNCSAEVTIVGKPTEHSGNGSLERNREGSITRAFPPKAARIAGDLFIRYVIRSSTDADPQSDDNSIISYMFDDRQHVLQSVDLLG